MISDANHRLSLLRKNLARIEKFETEVPVLKWKYKDIHIWPIIKYALVKPTIRSASAASLPSDKYKNYKKVSKRKALTPYNLIRTVLDPNFINIQKYFSLHQGKFCYLDDVQKQIDVMFFGSGSGFKKVDNAWISQHHHVLRGTLHEMGYNSIGYYNNLPESGAREKQKYGLNINLDPFIRHVINKSFVPSISCQFLKPHYEELNELIQQAGSEFTSFCSFTDTLLGRTNTARKIFRILLKQIRPRAIFTSNYASFYGWALAYECRQFAIPFIDIQHGLEGRYNGAYYWTQTPDDDWNIVPSKHLTWSQTDADNFISGHPQRKASVIGSHNFYSTEDSRVDHESLKTISASKPIFLFTGQSAEDVLLAKSLVEGGLSIVFRSHPTKLSESLELVSEEEANKIHFTLGSKANLPELIDFCDGLITGYSATLLEATMRGKHAYAIGVMAALIEEDYQSEMSSYLTVDPHFGEGNLIERILTWSGTLNTTSNKSIAKTSIRQSLLDIEAGL